jgi:uncharacterized protein (DUF2147 family)
MRRIPITIVTLMLVATPALAADPTGEWMVANGHAKIKIENCGKGLWGVVSWEQRPGGRDIKNPDPAKRDRPTLGMPILLDMQPSEPNEWAGHVYNAENGKTYEAHISLTNPDSLRIEGCVLGFLCGGESWTRVAEPDDAQDGAQTGARAGAAPPSSRTATPSARAGTPSSRTAAPSPRTAAPSQRAGRATPPQGRRGAPAATAQEEPPPLDVCSNVVGTTGLSHERRLK